MVKLVILACLVASVAATCDFTCHFNETHTKSIKVHHRKPAISFNDQVAMGLEVKFTWRRVFISRK